MQYITSALTTLLQGQGDQSKRYPFDPAVRLQGQEETMLYAPEGVLVAVLYRAVLDLYWTCTGPVLDTCTGTDMSKQDTTHEDTVICE